MFSFVLDIFWCYLEIFVVGCSSASSFADSSVIPQIGISRASCGIAGNHHQFRLETPHINPPPPNVVIVELMFHPSFFCIIIDFLLFLRSTILARLGNNCLDFLSVYQKLKERSFGPPPPGVVYFLINHN